MTDKKEKKGGETEGGKREGGREGRLVTWSHLIQGAGENVNNVRGRDSAFG